MGKDPSRREDRSKLIPRQKRLSDAHKTTSRQTETPNHNAQKQWKTEPHRGWRTPFTGQRSRGKGGVRNSTENGPRPFRSSTGRRETVVE